MQRRAKSRQPLKAVRHIPSGQFQPMLARDGQNVTREVVRHPLSEDEFHWQVSVSTIIDGCRCSFPGKDCTIGVFQGDGFCLEFQDSEAPHNSISLSKRGESFKFHGDWDARCNLLKPLASSDVVSFKVLTDRALFAHNTNILNLECDQPGVEAFPQHQQSGNSKESADDLYELPSKLVLLSLSGNAKAHFPKIQRIGGRMCLCPDCLGEGSEEGFNLGEGEALVMQPGNGIAVRALRESATVVAIQIYPNLDMEKAAPLSKM